MKRALLIGVSAVVVIVVAGIVVLYLNSGSIVKAAIENVGSKATQTRVVLDSVDISPTSGEAALKGFQMGNPAGFNTKNAMRVDLVSAKIDVGSIMKDVIVIKEVVIGAPQITYEVDSKGGSNFGTIQSNVQAFGKSMGAGQGQAAKPAKDGGGKKVIIENLYVRNGRVGVSAAFLGGKEMSAPLPTIHLANIGKDKGGATPEEVAETLLTSISQGAAKAVSSLGVDKMMKQGVEDAKKMLQSGNGGGSNAIEGGAKGVGEAVKGLFGK